MEDVCCANDTSIPSPTKAETQPDKEAETRPVVVEKGEEEKQEEGAVRETSDGSQMKTDRDEETLKASTPQKIINSMEGVVVPKVERIAMPDFLLLAMLISIPVVIYIVLFTTMGLGEETFYYLAERYGQYAYIAGLATTFLIGICYLLDFTDWDSETGKRRQMVVWSLVLIGVIAMVLLMVQDYPYGPIACFAFIIPIWLISLKSACIFQKLDTRTYTSWLSGPLFFVALVTGIYWFVWTFLEDENEWSEFNRILYADDSGCPRPDYREHPECESLVNPGQICVTVVNNEFVFEEANTTTLNSTEYCPAECSQIHDGCLNTFILWVGPALLSMVLIFLSFFTTFLKSESGEQDIVNFAKVWIFLLFAVWLTASLAGAAAGVASALMGLTLASFIGSAVFIASSVSVKDQKAHATGFWERMNEKYGSHMDIARGLGVVLLAPIFIIFLALSILNQCIRKCGLPCNKKFKTEEEGKDTFTKRGRDAIVTYQSWDRSKVFTYAVYWGAIFMIVNVIVAKFTVLFLSWLIDVTKDFDLIAVTGIMVGVGLLMFLLPPVPGVPIYLTLGIVIIAVGREQLGIIGCMAYGCAVSLVMKLLACTLQQKMIGELLYNYVAVRQMVGINSVVIRSMRLILQEPGVGLAKVAILVGGPDWPTSVLCGLMRLDLIPILIGTTPVFFLIVPTLLTGSFTYMASLKLPSGQPEFPNAATLATVFAAITAVVQFGAMVVAAYYLEETTRTKGEELDKIPIDKEVKEREDKQEEFNSCYKKVTEWHRVPFLAKALLIVALITMVVSCYMVQLFASLCFAEYELTYTIDENLDGDWKNFLLPLGRTACVLFIISCVEVYGYTSWAGCEARKFMAQNHHDEEAPEVDADSTNEKSTSKDEES